MRRKAFLLITMLLLISGLLLPAIYANKTSKSTAPQVVIGDMPKTSVPGKNFLDGSGGSPNDLSLKDLKGKGAPGVDPGQDSVKVPTGSAPVSGPEKNDSQPVLDVRKETVLINIAVLGKDGKVLFGPAPVEVEKKNRWGITALGALDSTGLAYDVSAGWSGFVEAVAGQRNKGLAGWMYQVNGEIPLVAADKKPVAAGDKIIWWYSKGIDIPPPSWDSF